MRALASLSFILMSIVVAGASCDGVEPVDITLSSIRADIFEPRCGFTACHGGSNPVRGLDLVLDPHASLVGVESEEEGIVRVVAGDPEASLLFQLINGPVGTASAMPPPSGGLPAEEIERIRGWIAAGAPND